MELRGFTLDEIWKQILRRIVHCGQVKYIKNHNQYVLELTEPLMVIINNPLEDIIPKGSGWNKKTLDLYAQQFLNSNGCGFAYTYGQRIGHYGQIMEVIDCLKNDHNNRQAIITTWEPKIDNLNPYPPCMIVLDFKIYNRGLHTTAYFRSNDMYMAYPQNFYGIANLSKHISKHVLNTEEIGPITTISNAPHIYLKELSKALVIADFDKEDREKLESVIFGMANKNIARGYHVSC